MRAAPLALLTAAALIAGCGDEGGETDTTALKPPAITEQASLAEPAPAGASLELKEIYRQFQPPEPNPEVKGSAKAIKEGEEACEGKTPTEVTEAFIAAADLTSDQQEAVSELPRFEANPSSSFPAGQVAALVYQQSLEGEILPSYGFQGCVYALSLGLKQELAPKAQKEGKG